MTLKNRLSETSLYVGNDHCHSKRTHDDLLGQLRSDARALWAVRVLDAWRKHSTLWWAVDNQGDEVSGSYWVVFTLAGSYRALAVGPSEDAARLAAAQTVFPTLPADVRAKLGECP
jgi:hypothetical protein